MTCPDCEYMMGAFDKECPRCAKMGKPTGPKFCPHCKAHLPPYALKCSNCHLDPHAVLVVSPQRPISVPLPHQVATRPVQGVFNQQPAVYAPPYSPGGPPGSSPSPGIAGKVCPNCQRVTDAAAVACMGCGYQFQAMPYPAAPPSYPPQPQYQAGPVGFPYQYGFVPGVIQLPPNTHNVAVSVLLGFMFLGAGQLVNRQAGKGVALFIAGVVAVIAAHGLGWLLVATAGLIDTVCIAQRLNRGEPVRTWQCF